MLLIVLSARRLQSLCISCCRCTVHQPIRSRLDKGCVKGQQTKCSELGVHRPTHSYTYITAVSGQGASTWAARCADNHSFRATGVKHTHSAATHASCRNAPGRIRRVAPGDVTPIAPADAEGVCPVCFDNLHPTATGGDTCVPFPTCAVHHMHLACLAQFRAQASGPSELLCPLCRHSLCPACSPGGWTGREDAALRHLCIQHDVSIPTRVSGESTVRAAVPDYALRTLTSHDAPEPRPPPGVRILCCHHIAAIGRAGGVDFIRLPDRTMRWAPVAIRLAAWQPTWVCMGCAQSEQLGDLLIPAEAGSPCDRC